jgi:A/G-specific adenine glycosylase
MSRETKSAPPEIDAKVRRAFRHGLVAWYGRHKRDLPWRRNPTPYAVAVSEFMCQQTQIATVLPYFDRWMKELPDWQALADAREERVLKLWEGLGYYRRARLLHQLARDVVALPGKELPGDVAELKKLSGIGDYTAGAIASIAFGLPAPVVDGNVERVLSRVFNLREDVRSKPVKEKLWALAGALLPEKEAGDFNQALMECGALVCTPSSPMCLTCPLEPVCLAPDPESLPVKVRTAITEEKETRAWIAKGGKVWVLTPDQPGRWGGFHRLPPFDADTMTQGRALFEIRYTITRFKVTASIVEASFTGKAPSRGVWMTMEALEHIALPAPHRKVVERMKTGKN